LKARNTRGETFRREKTPKRVKYAGHGPQFVKVSDQKDVLKKKCGGGACDQKGCLKEKRGEKETISRLERKLRRKEKSARKRMREL